MSEIKDKPVVPLIQVSEVRKNLLDSSVLFTEDEISLFENVAESIKNDPLTGENSGKEKQQ